MSLDDEFLRVFESTVEATTEAIVVADARKKDFPLIFVNRAFTRITGYEPEDILGKNCRFLQGPDTDEKAISKIRSALIEKKNTVVTLLNYRKDGTSFWNRLALVPVFDEKGRHNYHVGIQSDVTGNLKAQETISKHDAMKATLATVNDIIFNFFCFLKYLRMKMDDVDAMEGLKKEFDASYQDTLNKLNTLNDTKRYQEVHLAGATKGVYYEQAQLNKADREI